FQAEDGIRDGHVTGVQTCALPISLHPYRRDLPSRTRPSPRRRRGRTPRSARSATPPAPPPPPPGRAAAPGPRDGAGYSPTCCVLPCVGRPVVRGQARAPPGKTNRVS